MKKALVFCLISFQVVAGDLIFKNGFEQTVFISGSASGIESTGLSLNLNVASNNEILVVNSNGSFTFIMEVDFGESYVVSILSMPTSPPQNCRLANATGTVTTSIVNNIIVTCNPNHNWNQMNWNSGVWN